MFRPASRALLRAPAFAARNPVTRRYIGTARPDEKSRSWRNKAVRLGLAIGAVYYYNTSSVFAEEPSLSLRPKQSRNEDVEESTLTLDSVKPKIREERQKASSASGTKPQDDVARTDNQQPQTAQAQPEAFTLETGLKTSPEELEEEAGQEAAFNPETGEINWDCPCLGGMAHGPCGEEFKAAFSCFVFSSEEPKGIDCIDKFKGMQDCFRQHPDVYGSELEDDEAEPANQPENDAHVGSAEDASSISVSTAERDASSHPQDKQARAEAVRSEVKTTDAHTGEHPETEELLPKAWHDTHEQNEETKK